MRARDIGSGLTQAYLKTILRYDPERFGEFHSAS